MNIKRYGSIAAIAVAGTMLLASCAANEGNGATAPAADSAYADLTGTLVGGGASSQQAAQEAWVAGFQSRTNPDVTVEYDPTGSGTGRDNFIAGANAFTGSDRAFKDEELAAGRLRRLRARHRRWSRSPPTSPRSPSSSTSTASTRLNLDAPTIAKIFKGEITNWNDAAIASQNPDAELPDLAITAVHRSDESGTTENFVDYLAGRDPRGLGRRGFRRLGLPGRRSCTGHLRCR